MIFESIRMSLMNIAKNKLRSILTMLGIIIGVASIIALITIVEGATNNISSEVIKLGGNKILITVFGTSLKQGLTEKDVEHIASLGNITGVSPTVSGKTSVIYGNKVLKDISVEGKNEVFFKADPELLSSGRAINILDLESRNQVAVVGSNIVRELFFGINPIGEKIIINGMTYTVIGTLRESAGFSLSSTNDTVIIPYTTALRSMGIKNISTIDAYVEDTDLADRTLVEIKGILNQAFNYNEDAYKIYNMGDIISSFRSIMSMMSMLLAGIAAISLVVGGIGIMNMMLVSVTERTTEIGLRKALGATPFAIRLQFMIESIFLSLTGGFIGLIVGALLSYLLGEIIGIGISISASTNALAMSFSATVGIIFGYMPAVKASRLNPIDALRSV
ncbi:ABC transporter permease [Thermoclostridium stercorarium]|uniref:ABC transporter permease n=1 Tax=Thermoclostridium stercorarium TaxID=1510 RepID=UPI00224891BF|nr:ABC transporter permease [Thermoclostridium stercorarium]UZQ85622.1 ABC transporter permease [Thermoclostridium stercorarium]